MRELRDSVREENLNEFKEALPSIGFKKPGRIFDGDFSSDEFFELTSKLKIAYNAQTSETRASAKKILYLIDQMPGFEATFSWQIPGEPPVLENLPANPQLHDALKTFFVPYAGPEEKAKDYVTRALESQSIKDVETARLKTPEYSLADKFETRAADFRPTVRRALGMNESTEFTRGWYDKMIRALVKYRNGDRSTSATINNDLALLTELNSYLIEQSQRAGTGDDRFKRFKAMYDTYEDRG